MRLVINVNFDGSSKKFCDAKIVFSFSLPFHDHSLSLPVLMSMSVSVSVPPLLTNDQIITASFYFMYHFSLAQHYTLNLLKIVRLFSFYIFVKITFFSILFRSIFRWLFSLSSLYTITVLFQVQF